MSLKRRIEQKLESAFEPLFLDVEDVSHLHTSHGKYHAGVESHFKIGIVSEKFTELKRLQRHQLVHKVLEQEIKDLHALSLVLRSPAELD